MSFQFYPSTVANAKTANYAEKLMRGCLEYENATVVVASGVPKWDGLHYNNYVELAEEALLASGQAFKKPKNVNDLS